MSEATISEIEAAVAGQTAPKRFIETVRAHSAVVALRARDGDDWKEWTYGQVAAETSFAANGLAHYGVTAGQRVLLLMGNRPDFHWFDIAAQFLRATPVSIYNSSSAEEIGYLGQHAEAALAIVENVGFLNRLLAARGDLPALTHIFVIDPGDAPLPSGVLPASELSGHGAADLEALAAATQPDDLATLIYTSGTTGPPKGVMISQFNVVYTAEQLYRRARFTPERTPGMRLISYLPMAHIAERMTSHYQGMLFGFTVTCCPTPNEIANYAREVHPQIVFGVPRVWEKIHAGVEAVAGADPDRKRQLDEGVAAAKEIKAAERDGKATQEQLDTWAFLDAVAFSTIRGLLGFDQLELAVSGAAPLGRDVLEWFLAIGVPLAEVYGMSESSGPMTWDPHDVRPGTVGRVIPGSELQIADDGEVIYRGGNVFQGYLKDEAKTDEALIDGWLHSGDIGTLDEDGYLRIIDRKKELIITSGGKNISPANLEAAIKTIPGIGQAAAIGDGRKYVSALLVLDPETAPLVAKEIHLEGLTLSELAAAEPMIEHVQQGIDAINRQFAQVEQIKRFTLLGEEWLPDSDLLTPTSKLKRRGVQARYADLIEAMY